MSSHYMGDNLGPMDSCPDVAHLRRPCSTHLREENDINIHINTLNISSDEDDDDDGSRSFWDCFGTFESDTRPKRVTWTEPLAEILIIPSHRSYSNELWKWLHGHSPTLHRQWNNLWVAWLSQKPKQPVGSEPHPGLVTRPLRFRSRVIPEFSPRTLDLDGSASRLAEVARQACPGRLLSGMGDGTPHQCDVGTEPLAGPDSTSEGTEHPCHEQGAARGAGHREAGLEPEGGRSHHGGAAEAVPEGNGPDGTPERLLPSSWKRLNKPELAALADSKGIAPGKMTREELIRELTIWEGLAKGAAAMDCSMTSSPADSTCWQKLPGGNVPGASASSSLCPNMSDILTFVAQAKEALRSGWTIEQVSDWMETDGTATRLGPTVMQQILEMASRA